MDNSKAINLKEENTQRKEAETERPLLFLLRKKFEAAGQRKTRMQQRPLLEFATGGCWNPPRCSPEVSGHFPPSLIFNKTKRRKIFFREIIFF